MTLKGEYSYLEDNQSKKYLLTPEPLEINLAPAVATNTTEPVTTPTVAMVTPTETLALETPTVAVVTPTETVAVITQTETPTNTKPVNETVAKNDGSVNYMVQIGAFTNGNVTASVLKQKFGISETVKSEMQGGFSKFMVGSHREYKGARDQRERIRNNNGVKSAFVVAYNLSKRITVQEALMISNQKWYK
jgi:cell division septation protein DedD